MKNIWVLFLAVSFTQLVWGKSSAQEAEFSEIIEIARPLFIEKAASKNITLRLHGNWNNPIANAQTLVLGSDASISIYGGLFNLDLLTREGFVVALCHELGHVLGGAPYVGDFNNSVEGGADYYSSNDCLKELLPRLNLKSNLVTTVDVSNICSNETEEIVCQQILMGGLSLMNALLHRTENNIILNYYTPDKSVVAETLKFYPGYQCRIDTILRGYFNLDRPACWYNKNDPNNSSTGGVITI